MNKKSLLSGLMACCFGASAFAATEIYVKAGSGNDNYNGASWNTAFKTLQKAVSSVNPNEETIIYLEPDALFDTGGTLTLGENMQLSIVGDNTTVQGASQPGTAGQASRILRLSVGSNVKIKGITFQNGRQVGYYSGGAIFFDGETLEIDSCKFLNNEAGSGGGAIGSRGKHLIIRNSYFEGNYLFSGGEGAAVMHSGKNDDSTDNTLLVENCTFYQNKMTDWGNGTAISLFDASDGNKYSNIQTAKIANSTFLENTTPTAYQAAVDFTHNDQTKIQLINNTFYKQDGAVRVGDIWAEKGGEVIMINNLIYAEKAGILGADNYSVADYRAPIIGYNNIVVGTERGVNENIDDECFNEKQSEYNNKVATTATYPLSMVALATSLSNENSFVPYLALTAENSDAVDAGYSEGEYADLVPETDIRGYMKVGVRDIGAYEYPSKTAIFSPKADVPDFFIISQGENTVTVVNTANHDIDLNVVDLFGRTVYSSVVKDVLSINKQELNTHCAVFVLNDGANRKARKLIID